MENGNLSLKEALARLEEIAPNAPFLALGQTVFWDEPMKAGVAVASRRAGYSRRFLAGVHDTDYFAKIPSGRRQAGRFKTLPHNDTSTKGLWSAAGEFSTLFGSETVVTRETLLKAGANLEIVRRARPEILDEITEAWGWRGVVSLDDAPPVSAELPLAPVFNEIRSAFDWALDGAVGAIAGQAKQDAEQVADELRSSLCDAREAEDNPTLSSFYQRLLRPFYDQVAGVPTQIEATATTELLRFNSETASLPRFKLLNTFLVPESREFGESAYNRAIAGTGLYEISRFGSGAIPFDLVIPGKGRGTIRIGRRGLVIMTRQPQFASFKRPIESVQDLAEVIEKKFGKNCTLVGKAVTLIGMLATEFVFVFHEGASSYVKYSRALHEALAKHGASLDLNPILRVRYRAWDALQVACTWLQLPEPFQRPFATEEVCAPSLAARWEAVAKEQESVLAKLGELRRPIELIRFLESQVGGSWECLAKEYEELHKELDRLKRQIDEARDRRRALYDELRALKAKRVQLEVDKGQHFREAIFEKAADDNATEERASFVREIELVMHQIEQLQTQKRHLMREQKELATDPTIIEVHERRRQIELEAELKRLRMIRDAVISSRGLQNANLRPSAWWFPLVSPDGLWFRETVDSAECYLEPLTV